VHTQKVSQKVKKRTPAYPSPQTFVDNVFIIVICAEERKKEQGGQTK
jgi:hypothetical protein